MADLGRSAKMRHSQLFLSIAALFLLTGCLSVTQSGVYDGSEAAGWVHSVQNGGVSVYTFGALKKPAGRISFATLEDGSVYVGAFPPSAVVRFTGPVKIVFNDLGTSRTLAFEGEMKLDVKGSRDFTVTLPAHTELDVSLPELTARFRWSDRNVRYYKQLQ